MKSKLFLLGASALLLASCSNELDLPQNEVLGGGGTPLSVNVATESITKALVSGTSLPNSSKIGVKLVKSDGTNYDNKTYNNIFYSTTDGSSWTVDAANKILLSATEGKAYAYYPYTATSSLDFTEIPISSAENPDDQVDYMFGNEASGLKNSNPTASFTMSHAMSIVNFTIAKGSYTGTGLITSVKMKGNTASNTGTMNAVAGTVTATNAGYEFTSTNSLTLGNSSTGKFIVVPSGTSSALDFKVVMDGQTYTASTAAVELENGQVYKYTLTMNSTGLTVSTVTVSPWGAEQNQGSLDTELYQPWAGLSDGVYAIDNKSEPVDYATANSSSGSYKGVALVMNGKAIEIALSDASTGTTWAATRPMSETEQAYFSANYIVETTIAKVDMEGKANSQRILESGVTIATVINNFNTSNGTTSWYLPSAGQLYNIDTNVNQINTLLEKVSGTAVSKKEDYWSSSVRSAGFAWYVRFGYGYVSNYGVADATIRVRLVRDL